MQKMRGICLLVGSLICLVDCTSRFAADDPHESERRLLEVVPVGAPEHELMDASAKQGWRVVGTPYASDGLPTDLTDRSYKCVSEKGGKVIPMIISEYWTPLKTTLEAQWIMDQQGRVARVCIRRTTDAP